MDEFDKSVVDKIAREHIWLLIDDLGRELDRRAAASMSPFVSWLDLMSALAVVRQTYA
jgi:hypothetical protein